MRSHLRRVQAGALAALLGSLLIVAACTGPTGASTAPVGASAPAASNAPASAAPTKGGNGY